MSDDQSGDRPDDEQGRPGDDRSGGGQNPFAGTPFEQLFGALGGGAGGLGGLAGGLGGLGGPGGQVPDLSALMGQVQQMMAPYDGAVNWDLATDTARKSVAAQRDPSTSARDRDRVADAVRLADLWLDETTTFSSGVRTTAAWSRSEWITGTVPVWKVLVEPVAEHVTSALTDALPEEAKAMAGPFLGMLSRAGGVMFGAQVGQALGALAGEVLSASDIGLPLGPEGAAALVTGNVATFAEGLDVGEDDVLLYLALREAAHQRLFAHVPWLRQHLISAIEDYGRGASLDLSSMEEKLSGLNPMDPSALQEALEGGLFEPEKTPTQQAALQRLEVTLALVEGWVDEVVGQATAERMPQAARLQEAVRRRRAAGGPAEQAFGALVGLELRPRRLRDASTLWGSLRTRQGVEARDAVWTHPDLLPTAADLDDPLGFREDVTAPAELSADDFDAELAKLLDEGTGGTGGTDGSDGSEGPEGSGSDEPEDGPR